MPWRTSSSAGSVRRTYQAALYTGRKPAVLSAWLTLSTALTMPS